MKKSILFIGAGNMGQAIIRGVLKNGLYSKDQIIIYEPFEHTRTKVCEEFGIKACEQLSKTILNESALIVLAVKPQVFHSNELDVLCTLVNQNHLIISIMAGISTQQIYNKFSQLTQCIRVMPNTPALIGQGMSVISVDAQIKEENKTITEKLFKAVGEVLFLDETSLDAVTALSGSGPAFVMTFIEALTSGGVLCGLPKTISEKLALQTLLGSVQMGLQSDKNIEELRHMVTSPGGTTIHGMATLEAHGFRSSIIKSIFAAYTKSKELG